MYSPVVTLVLLAARPLLVAGPLQAIAPLAVAAVPVAPILAAARIVPPVPPDDSITLPLPRTLEVIDIASYAAAAALLLGVALWWFVRGRPDPLAHAPVRKHELREESILLPVMAFLVGALVVGGAASLLGQGQGDAQGNAQADAQVDVVGILFVSSSAQICGLLACLFIAARAFEGGALRFLFGAATGRVARGVIMTGGSALLAIGLCPLVYWLTVTLVLSINPDATLETHTTLAALHDPRQPMWIVVALWTSAAVIAPVVEEVYFRGIVQTTIAGLVNRRWVGILIASCAFGAVHLQVPHTIPALIVLGIIAGYAYERTGSLLAPIFIHALFNLKTLLWDAIAA